MDSRQKNLKSFKIKTVLLLLVLILASSAVIYGQVSAANAPSQAANQDPLPLLYLSYQNALLVNNQAALKSVLAKTSLLIQQAPDPIDALKFRFSVYMALKMKSHALADLKKINKLEPIGERVLMECAYYREINKSRRLNACYQRAISAFETQLIAPNEHVIYLLTKLLLNHQDPEALQQFSALLNSTDGPLSTRDYEFWGRDVLGVDLYQKLFEK